VRDEVEYALDMLGLDGITLLTNYRGAYLGDDAFDPLFAELDRRGTPVFIHPSTPAGQELPTFGYPVGFYEFLFDTTRTVAHLLYGGTLSRYPGLRLILPHAGGTVPFLAGRLAMVAGVLPQIRERAPADIVAALRGLYYDTAMAATPYAVPSLRALADPAHILFGSDWPFVSEPIVAATVAGLADYPGLAPQERGAIARENAMQLFPHLRGRLAAAGALRHRQS
jgi:predicted TIM-barrel fold metal-dependent hydrolase